MKGLIAGPAAILAILYAGGYLAQFIGNYAVWKQGGGIPGDGTSPVMASPDFISCITTVFQPPYGLYGVLICIGLLAILLIMVMRMGYSDSGEYDKDRNFTSWNHSWPAGQQDSVYAGGNALQCKHGRVRCKRLYENKSLLYEPHSPECCPWRIPNYL